MKSHSGKPEGFILFIVITTQKGPLHRWLPHMAKRLNSLWGQEELPFSFLIDSFLDEGLARQAGLPFKALSEAKVVLDLSGHVLTRVTLVIIAKVSNCV